MKPLPQDSLILSLTDCLECRKLLRVRFVLRLMSHLNEHHGHSENEAIETATKLSEIMYNRRKGV